MKVLDFVQLLQQRFPEVKFYQGFINKNEEKCVGIYIGSTSPKPSLALGGIENTSYGVIPIRILIHWTQSSVECENIANDIFNYLLGLSNIEINNHRIILIDLLDSYPVYIGRDDNNICEMVIRLNIYYQRR